jgi:superfamily II DNA or RNA helicase
MSLKLERPEDQSVFEKQGDALFAGLDTLSQHKKIYKHQAEAVRAVRNDLLHSGTQQDNVDCGNVSLVVLPTGTGKTGVGVLAAYVCKAKRVLVVTPSEAISKQQLTQFKPVGDISLNPLQNKPFLCEREVFDFKGTPDYDHWVPRSKCILKASELKSAIGERYEIVVTNAHKFGDGSGKGADINTFPKNYFSLVIVDEAHHFPAKTWKNIVDHFQEGEMILFLTATPYNRGDYILPDKKPCYILSHEAAVAKGIIRKPQFIEATPDDLFDIKNDRTYDQTECNIMSVLQKVRDTLNAHDHEDNYVHKAMILAKDKQNARDICTLWNEHYNSDPNADSCVTFIQNDSKTNVNRFMTEDEIKILVVIYRLTEGFDYKQISVAAILRNVNKKSRVYFAQFVGRAVRKLHPSDPVKATVISHVVYNQRPNYDAFKNCELAEDIDEDPTLLDAEDIEQESE